MVGKDDVRRIIKPLLKDAQNAIRTKVSTALVRYREEGRSLGALNMSEVDLRSLML
ncbi:hypothetical protein P153DRAFT_371440 [Dothidotthia symphoricarpi CBS 119687]|uniref:Uncharacterized protein n=1 Tax=Dothidotthia symphoricarpi CBS 119687 TaxID=1392245 RepID=A0A6A5ZXY4_9PLEO|nr:uncharacterized protein P153DRAFT_371440 [Dothidotthia symphoricarpi CBS 119687]KAF2123764.1 hypothetical protein P153DRAFT_371440 [Dothidotthia symphoricarpi CBS 119687]